MCHKKRKMQYHHYQNSGQRLSQQTFICTIEAAEINNRSISKSVKYVQSYQSTKVTRMKSMMPSWCLYC